MQPKNLFYLLYNATTEGEVEKLVKKNPVFQKKENWKPLGGHENNFGVIENQQSSNTRRLAAGLGKTRQVSASESQQSWNSKKNGASGNK